MAFGDWADVNSSNLSAVRYDDENGTLQIRFKTGAVYEWYGVQQDQATGITSSDSPGKYLNANIHGIYGAGLKVHG